MREYFPVLIIGAILGIVSTCFILAYAFMKNKKEAIGFDRHMKDGELIRRMAVYARPQLKSFIAVGGLMLFSIIYDVLSPLLIGSVEKLVKEDFELSRLFALLAVYASILIISLVCSYIQSILLQRIGQRILSSLREATFSHIQSLSHGQLNMIPVGKLVTRVTNDTNSISLVFTTLFVNLAKNSFVVLGVLAAMLCLNYTLTLVVLCFVPFVVLFTLCLRKFLRRSFRRVKDATTDINTFLSENLSGIKITQIFNREKRKMGEFFEKNKSLSSAKRQQVLMEGIFRPIIYMLYISSVLCLFYFGGKGYLNGVTFMGDPIGSEVIVAFYMYIAKFFNPIQSLAEQFNWLQSALASAEKIFSILDITPNVVDEEGAIELEEIRGEIEFKDVWFSYVPDEWILKGVSFKAKAGETVAFVGSTGAGKTTILSLLCRNYDIQKGEILVDGINIRRVKISSLRKHFGQMLQDVFLFAGSLRSNIVMMEEGFSDERVMEVCRYVNADSFINKLEKGLDEPVRERGNNFSAGQRQLISFARTIIHSPSVMILDEATANIDTETEVLIQDSLEKMRSVGTMLIVAHRLSTIQHADKIIVLSSGRVIEEGTHQELLKNRGKYYQLYEMQGHKENMLK